MGRAQPHRRRSLRALARLPHRGRVHGEWTEAASRPRGVVHARVYRAAPVHCGQAACDETRAHWPRRARTPQRHHHTHDQPSAHRGRAKRQRLVHPLHEHHRRPNAAEKLHGARPRHVPMRRGTLPGGLRHVRTLPRWNHPEEIAHRRALRDAHVDDGRGVVCAQLPQLSRHAPRLAVRPRRLADGPGQLHGAARVPQHPARPACSGDEPGDAPGDDTPDRHQAARALPQDR